MNNLIKRVKRVAFGFSNFTQLPGPRPALRGQARLDEAGVDLPLVSPGSGLTFADGSSRSSRIPAYMLAVLFGIEGAEVLKFVDDEENDAFAVLIETPLTSTTCPKMRLRRRGGGTCHPGAPPDHGRTQAPAHRVEATSVAVHDTRRAARSSSQNRVTTSMRSSPGSRSAEHLRLKPR